MNGLPATRPWLGAALALSLLLALTAQLPHLSDDAWEDEAATLLLFASGTPLDAFSDYRLPNNHMLFSAALAAWWSRGDSVMHARTLPLAVWLLTMVVMTCAGRRVFGWPAAALGVALWSGAALTGLFALALRGYAFSWPWLLVLLVAAQRWVTQGGWPAGLACVLLGAGACVILPTNAIAVAVCLLWALCATPGAQRWPARGAWLRAAGALAGAALGLLVYLPHRVQIAAQLAHGFSTWAPREVLALWGLASSAQWWPLAPLLLWGAVRGARQEGTRHALLLLLIALAVPAGALLVSPTPLVPRALVPLLPLWCLAVGALLAAGGTDLAARWRTAPTPLLALLALAAFACGRVVPACGGGSWHFPPGDELCRPYYRADYHPQALLAALTEHYPDVPVLVSPRELFAFTFARWNTNAVQARVVAQHRWRQAYPAQLPLLVIAASSTEARALVAPFSATGPLAVEVAIDAGQVVLYALRWR